MTLATPRTEINNEIVSLRQYVRQARICMINKLIREAKRLRSKHGNEKQLEKNKNKADKYFREVFALKQIKDDEISKFGILNLEHLQDVLQNLNTDDETRAMIKVARYKSLKEKLVEFKHKFPNYREHVCLKKKKPSIRKKGKNPLDEIQDGNDKRVVKNTNKVQQANVTSIDHSRYITVEENIETDGNCKHQSKEMSVHKAKKNKCEQEVNRNTKRARNHEGSKSAIKVISNEAAVKRFAELLLETNAQATNDRCEANKKQEMSDESLEIRENTDDFFLNSNEIVSCPKVETFSQQRYTNIGDDTFEALQIRNERDKFHRNKVNKDRRNTKVGKIDNEDTCNDRNRITEREAGNVPWKQNKMITSVKKTGVAQRNIKSAKPLENENLHPSWAARKKQQEVMKQGFQGKKIRFDDN
ncbi:serum response factor-binding protein 1-like [Hylaeus anthracinus]|uniref:serum response factor-binding protein 1-like n=1 Tax=Hylaeus anthracinus TaxID=313031 RepID=UPI0023B9345A|nr:serum response factor-binding protein 1-like [Hylaeus anthracinus]